MRAEAFVLPELFARRAFSFVCAPQQARTEATRRVAFLRTAPPRRGTFAECQASDERRALCQTRRARRFEHDDTFALDQTCESLN